MQVSYGILGYRYIKYMVQFNSFDYDAIQYVTKQIYISYHISYLNIYQISYHISCIVSDDVISHPIICCDIFQYETADFVLPVHFSCSLCRDLCEHHSAASTKLICPLLPPISSCERLIVPMKCINIMSFRKPPSCRRWVGVGRPQAGGGPRERTQINGGRVSRLSLFQVVPQVGRHLHGPLRGGSGPLHGADERRPEPVVQLRLHSRGSVCGRSTALCSGRERTKSVSRTDWQEPQKHE